ncbi:response regulator transcription factor [Paraburkholderia aspalathi]|uniref:Two-component system, OmpR family, phosphate regulon response regulator OmpR n=1 Tax=Paraburkholderia aspalathi TaxID=1324617 RepID=A0A1I7BFC3_9BURK|nr:response regulator transcription factor [Paraburkholderia aspalathi]SFT85801.1 two-component system, OmpR family, phosphate regulon response regulator OmpR [Paraburkholderia aspalathi]
MKPRILVVDDDPDCRDALRKCLQSNGFDVAVLYEPARVLERLEVERPALIVMKSGPSFGGGLATLRMLREHREDMPVILLAEQDDVIERVVALECGADDVLSRPFNVKEVLVRIRCVLRRVMYEPLHSPVHRQPFRFGGFELNFALRTLSFEGRPVPLQQTEYAVLHLFTTAPDRVLSREFIAHCIHSSARDQLPVVGLWIHRLRRRIETDSSYPKLIQTVRAKGYVFHPWATDDATTGTLISPPCRTLQRPAYTRTDDPPATHQPASRSRQA